MSSGSTSDLSDHHVPTGERLWQPKTMMAWLCHTLKALLLTLLAVLQRWVCCGRRKSRSPSLPAYHQTGGGSLTRDEDLDDWNKWEDDPEIVISGRHEPETVQDHIAAYRESLQEARQQRQISETPSEEPEPAADLFAELEPTFKRQKKIYVGPKSPPGSLAGSGPATSRLGVQEVMADPLLAMGNELAEWGSNAGSNAGWQPEDEDVSDVLRETRKQTKP